MDPEVAAQRNMEMVCSTESIVWGGALEQSFKERSTSGVEVRVRAMLVMQAIQVSFHHIQNTQKAQQQRSKSTAATLDLVWSIEASLSSRRMGCLRGVRDRYHAPLTHEAYIPQNASSAPWPSAPSLHHRSHQLHLPDRAMLNKLTVGILGRFFRRRRIRPSRW